MQKILGKKQGRKAFTLIELLVVVAIIGILAAVGVVAYNGYTSSAKVTTSKTNYKNILKHVTAEITKCNNGISNTFLTTDLKEKLIFWIHRTFQYYQKPI